MPKYTFAQLTQMTPKELDRLLAEGTAPPLSSLEGWEFRGYNVLPLYAKLYMSATQNVRFIKCFFASPDVESAELKGYNLLVKNGGVDEPWATRPNEEKPGRIGHYVVHEKRVHGSDARIAEHPNAVFLDYNIPPNNLFTGRTLEDYLVQPDPDDPDLLVGKAYLSVWPLRVGFNFVLERYRRHDR